MFILRKGCKVPLPDKLSEGYMIRDNRIIANVSAEKIRPITEDFILAHNEPIFFILELPSKNVGEAISGELHKDVYYIDGCSTEKALRIFRSVGDVVINDGLCSFGFGCHESKDEIMFGKYNVMTIFSERIEQYDNFLAKNEIRKTDELVTAWDTFTGGCAGYCERVETAGKDVFSIPKELAQCGMYKAEQRQD